MKNIVLALAAIVVSSAAAAPTLAQSTDRHGMVEVTRVVPYGDLNLATDRGRQRLALRLNNAIERVCGRRSQYLTVEQRRRECIATVRDDVEVQLAQSPRTVELARSTRGSGGAIRF